MEFTNTLASSALEIDGARQALFQVISWRLITLTRAESASIECILLHFSYCACRIRAVALGVLKLVASPTC